MQGNISRALSEVVSVDGWRAEFDKDDRSTVHVDLSFFEGKVGAEDEFEVTFSVALRRAVLKLVIPENEPIAVMQSTVDREQTVEAIRKTLSESQYGTKGKINIKGSLAKPIGISASGGVEAKGAKRHKVTTESKEPIRQFDIRQFKDSEGCYCWEISGFDGSVMNGKVWNPVKQPRLSLKQSVDSMIEPVLRAVVTCRRCDLIIENVTLKKGAPFQDKFTLNRKAAAEAVIRTRILGESLEHPDADNDLIEIQIAETLVVQEVN